MALANCLFVGKKVANYVTIGMRGVVMDETINPLSGLTVSDIARTSVGPT